MTPPPDRAPLPTCVNDLPPAPDAYTATVAAGLAAALGEQIGGGVTAAQFEAIADHARLLMAWNQAINLSGIREPDAIALEHVLDSLAAVPLMKRAGIEEFLDLGSGGGYPGLPLAVALPVRRALLVESVGKKARFLATAVECLGIHDRVHVAATRAETLAADPHHRGQWQAVTARAVTGMSELVELALPLLMVGGLLIAWKRRPAEEELEKAGMALHRVGGRIVRLEAITVPGLEDHVLAVVEKIAETPPQFPRDPAVRRRLPL
ncbi:MAG TPA: 16S rRNA (guanine(527)-N(7))-methyltransferase RsmG [Candidatus Limnocylindrales bacterium]